MFWGALLVATKLDKNTIICPYLGIRTKYDRF